MKVKYFTNNKIDKSISKMNTFFANLQYWQYKAGQEKSACHVKETGSDSASKML